MAVQQTRSFWLLDMPPNGSVLPLDIHLKIFQLVTVETNRVTQPCNKRLMSESLINGETPLFFKCLKTRNPNIYTFFIMITVMTVYISPT